MACSAYWVCATKHYQNVYQFKITLKDAKPPIWRRIQVPENYRFWDLHVAIQDAMDWEDRHLHLFTIAPHLNKDRIEIGLPEAKEYLNSRNELIADYFSEESSAAEYLYDFGDAWLHKLQFEKILPAKQDLDYPICLAGRRACPPENIGGIPGYQLILKALSDPNHPAHKDCRRLVGRKYDPEKFDPKAVIFDNPIWRERISFGTDPINKE